MDDLIAILRKILNNPTIDLDRDTPLVSIGVDSLARVDLLLECEIRFEKVLPDELINDATFRTPGSLLTAFGR